MERKKMWEVQNLLWKKTKKRQKTNPNHPPPPSDDLTSQLETSFHTSVPYETPAKFKKQIRQWTSDCHSKLPQSKELKCAAVNHVVGKMLNSPSTSSTMCQITQQYNKPLLKNHDRNYSSLVSDVVELQKQMWEKYDKVYGMCKSCEREIQHLGSS